MVPQTTPNRVTYLLDCFSLKKRNTDYDFPPPLYVGGK